MKAYEGMLGWTAEIRGTQALSSYWPFLLTFAKVAQAPIRQLREFTIRAILAGDDFSNGRPFRLRLELDLSSTVLDQTLAEVRRLHDQGLWR